MTAAGRLLAISDLHVAYPENRAHVDGLRPGHEDDWLLVAGDVAERVEDVEWALRTLRERFATVVWAPGNHELWTSPGPPAGAAERSPRSSGPDQPASPGDTLRGVARYEHLVSVCRAIGVLTPEDPYPTWPGPGGPVRVVPLFVLYDYTYRPDGAATKEEALARAYAAGVIATDEARLHPDPYPSRDAWCAARVDGTKRRLDALDSGVPLVFVNHFPLVREPTRVLRYPEFAQWCGTERTADWHVRYPTAAVVYGHLHIPRTTWYDGVRFEEVSVGYPREWRRRGGPPPYRQILPYDGRTAR